MAEDLGLFPGGCGIQADYIIFLLRVRIPYKRYDRENLLKWPLPLASVMVKTEF
jgi:hypothetical protein